MKLIGYSPSAPGTYSIFDRGTLTSTAHAFVDTLKIDYASNFVVLDPDGATYNGERGGVVVAGPGDVALEFHWGGGAPATGHVGRSTLGAINRLWSTGVALSRSNWGEPPAVGNVSTD